MKDFIMQKNNPRELINEVFDQRTKSMLNQAITDGYNHLNKWLKDDLNLFLEPHNKEARGRVINWLIDFYVGQLVNKNAIDFSCHFDNTDVSGIPYLVLTSNKFSAELTINQVASRTAVARPSKGRNNKVTPFQSYFNLFGEGDMIIDEKPLYFQMTHGYQSLMPKFVVIGIPSEDNKRWEGSIDISAELSYLSTEFETEPFTFEQPTLDELFKNARSIEGD